MSAAPPAAMTGQARSCAGVGPAKRLPNQVSSTGWNICSVYLRRHPRQRLFPGGRPGCSAWPLLGRVGPLADLQHPEDQAVRRVDDGGQADGEDDLDDVRADDDLDD